MALYNRSINFCLLSTACSPIPANSFSSYHLSLIRCIDIGLSTSYVSEYKWKKQGAHREARKHSAARSRKKGRHNLQERREQLMFFSSFD